MFDVQSYHCFGKAEFHKSSLIFSTLNVEPLAQTWIRCECLYSSSQNGLTSPKRIQSSLALRGVGYEPEARAGLNHSTYSFVSQHDLYGFPRPFVQQFICLLGSVNIKAMGDKISRFNATDHLPGDTQTSVF